jgi:hypothetical protein
MYTFPARAVTNPLSGSWLSVDLPENGEEGAALGTRARVVHKRPSSARTDPRLIEQELRRERGPSSAVSFYA